MRFPFAPDRIATSGHLAFTPIVVEPAGSPVALAASRKRKQAKFRIRSDAFRKRLGAVAAAVLSASKN